MPKWILFTLIILLSSLQFRLWGKDDGIRDVLRLKQTIRLQTQEIDRLKHRNQSLDADVQALKNFPESLEERARSELGMIKHNETFYLISK